MLYSVGEKLGPKLLQFESLMVPLACVLVLCHYVVEIHQEAVQPLGMRPGQWSQVTRNGPLNIIAQSVIVAWYSASWSTRL